jgi:hypothetical protein
MNQINYALFEMFIFLKDVLEWGARKADDLAIKFYHRTNQHD